ncbi:MAG TPA: mechanosensitive ion channel [Thiobacillaceae bacterium]|nr:mechanosensitive ion channel [Thiobacillaceae bacterium]
MDLTAFSNAVQSTVGTHLPAILAAIAILVAGYLLAVIARAGTRKLLGMARINKYVADSSGKPMDVEGGSGLVVFGFILLITLIAMFNTLNLDQLAGPFGAMVTQIMQYLPSLLAGVLLLVVAWVVATVVRAISNKALKATQWDEKLTETAGMAPLGDNVGNILFWLVILLFLPAILGAMQLDGMLEPVRGMVAEALNMLPNVFGAAIILFAGWLVARIVRGLVSNLLAATGVDKLGQTAGLSESTQISRLVGTLVFVLILVPVLIAALDALQIAAIAQPASDMLGMILAAIPNILAAALILVITWYVARLAAGLVGRLLANLGFNSLPAKIGMANAFPETFQASDLVSRVLVFFAMLFATVEAANRLGFDQVESLVGMFIEFGGDVLLGVAILLIGFWLANLAHQAMMRASDGAAVGMASIVRYAILGMVLAMGLSAMGLADDIVNMAFAFVFGAVAVAIALSFGLGGREAAGRQMEYWLAKLRKDDTQ